MPTGFEVDTETPKNVSTVAADFGAVMTDFDDTAHDAAFVQFEIDTDSSFPDPTQLGDETDIGLVSQGTSVFKRAEGLTADTSYFVRAQAENVVYSDDTLFSDAAKNSKGFMVDVSNKDIGNAVTSATANEGMAQFDESASNVLKTSNVVSDFWSLDQATQNFWDAGSFSGSSNEGFWSRDVEMSGASNLKVDVRGVLSGSEFGSYESLLYDVGTIPDLFTVNSAGEIVDVDFGEMEVRSLSDGSIVHSTSTPFNTDTANLGPSDEVYLTGGSDVYIYDSDLNQINNFTATDPAERAEVDSSGNIILVDQGISIRKYDSSGNELWSNSSPSDFDNIVTDDSDNIYAEDYIDNVIRKIDSSGTEQWSVSISDPVEYFAFSNVDNALYVSDNSPIIRKLDASDGSEIWSMNPVSDNDNSEYALDVGPNNNLYAIVVDTPYDILKLDKDGNELWRHDPSSQGLTYNVSVDPVTSNLVHNYKESSGTYYAGKVIQSATGPPLTIKTVDGSLNLSEEVNSSSYSTKTIDISSVSGWKELQLGIDGDISPDSYIQGLNVGATGSGNSLYIYNDSGSVGDASTVAEFSDLRLE